MSHRKITVEVVALLVNTLEIPGPNPCLETVYSDSAFSQISSVTPAKFCGSNTE